MTTRTDPLQRPARTAVSSAPTPTASASCWPAIAAPRATTERAAPARQPRHRPRPFGLDVRRQARRRPRGGRGGHRPAPAGRPLQRRGLRRRGRRGHRVHDRPRPRRAAALSPASRRSRRAGAPNLGEGWLRGCEQVASHLADRGRQPLPAADRRPRQRRHHRRATSWRSHAAELRARGVSTSTFGVGDDFDERLLQALADAGGGHFYYIATRRRSADAITSEVGETLEVVARDVALEMTAREDIRVEPISPYRGDAARQRTVVSLGDLVSEQVVEVVLRLSFPYGALGRETGAIVALTDRDGVFAGAGGRPSRSGSPGLRGRPRQRRAAARSRRRPGRRPPVRRPGAPGGGRPQPRGDFVGARRVLDGDRGRIRGVCRRRPGSPLAGGGRSRARSWCLAAPMAEPAGSSSTTPARTSLRSRDGSGHSIKRA